MFHSTGPGKIEVDPSFSGAGLLKALLYNFDFDDFPVHNKYHPLKAEHASFVTDKVIPLLENDRGNIFLRGSASRIGTNAYNMDLSKIRPGAVVEVLLSKGIDSEQIQQNAVGEDLAQTHSEDDPRDRSVALWVFPKFHIEFPPPPLPVVVPRKPPVSRHFKIAMVTGLSVSQALNVGKVIRNLKVGAGVAVEYDIFMIWDTTNHISCLYAYYGLGIGAGVANLPSVAATTHGPWNEFTTEKPISCWQFGNYARFTSAGIGSHSINWITIETPPGVNDIHHLRIDTGTTLGLGMSSTVSYDFLLIDKPRRFVD